MIRGLVESAFIPFVGFSDLDNNVFKGLTSLLNVEQEIQYDELDFSWVELVFRTVELNLS
jgi:hypothetical protein